MVEESAELLVGEGLTRFYEDPVEGAINLLKIRKGGNVRRTRVFLQKWLGRRRGRRIAAKLRNVR